MKHIAKWGAALGLGALMLGWAGQTAARADGDDWRWRREERIRHEIAERRREERRERWRREHEREFRDHAFRYDDDRDFRYDHGHRPASHRR